MNSTSSLPTVAPRTDERRQNAVQVWQISLQRTKLDVPLLSEFCKRVFAAMLVGDEDQIISCSEKGAHAHHGNISGGRAAGRHKDREEACHGGHDQNNEYALEDISRCQA